MLKKYYEVVGLFNSIEDLNRAVNELFLHGFDSFSLSVLANSETQQLRFKIGHKTITKLVDNPNTPKAPFYGEENFGIVEGAVMSVLVYICTLVTVGIAISKNAQFNVFFIVVLTVFLISGLVSVMFAIMINKRHKRYINNQLKKGGIPLWVRIEEESKQDIVKKVLANNYAKNIHLLNIVPQNLNL